MNIFDIMGPVMVGPSSSHTAGAARIGYIGRKLLGFQPARADIGLHGSFAGTGVGHGTDKALVAGLLGMKPDDLNIPNSFAAAARQGLNFTFREIDLRDAHPNSVLLDLEGIGGRAIQVQACSTGGGRILVNRIAGVDVSFTGDYHTLIIHNKDDRGHVGEVTYTLAQAKVNVANMSLSRSVRGGSAMMVIETDDPIPQPLLDYFQQLPGILQVTYYKKED